MELSLDAPHFVNSKNFLFIIYSGYVDHILRKLRLSKFQKLKIIIIIHTGHKKVTNIKMIRSNELLTEALSDLTVVSFHFNNNVLTNSMVILNAMELSQKKQQHGA